MSEILDVVFRTSVVYLLIVFGIRLFGKREISQLSIIDLVFILLISNSVQNAMVGPSTSLLSGLIAAASLFILNIIFRTLTSRYTRFEKFIEGQPVMLIYKGKILEDRLAKTGVTRHELEEAVREHGVEKVSEVDLAILEIDGNISVMSEKFKHRTIRKRKAHKAVSEYI